tara:strand:- start:616 stop:1380 length:765 start_codon:yes stop_codon:yes gene_type:complete
MDWIAGCALVESFENHDEDKEKTTSVAEERTTSVAEEQTTSVVEDEDEDEDEVESEEDEDEDEEDDDEQEQTTSVANEESNNSDEFFDTRQIISFTLEGNMIVKLTDDDTLQELKQSEDDSEKLIDVYKKEKEDATVQEYIKENYKIKDETDGVVFTNMENKKSFKFMVSAENLEEDVEEDEDEGFEPFVGSMGSKVNVKFLLKAVLFSCLFYLLAHNDSRKFVVGLLKIRKAHYLYVAMSLFFLIYLVLNLIV